MKDLYLTSFTSPLKKLMEGKKTQEKLRWVNSPNVYQKVEVLETGTSDPKKITKVVVVHIFVSLKS